MKKNKKKKIKTSYIVNSSKKITKPNEKFITKFERCYLCGGWLNPYTSNIDHVIPKSRQGLDVKLNKKLVHTRCNFKKDSNLDTVIFNGVLCIQADRLLKYSYSAAKLILVKKVFPDINWTDLPENVLTLDDYNKFKKLCEAYKIKVRNSTVFGYVPIGSKLLKFNNDFTLNDTEMGIITTQLVDTLLLNNKLKIA